MKTKHILTTLILIIILLGATLVVYADNDPYTTTLYKADSISDFDIETAEPTLKFVDENRCHTMAFKINHALLNDTNSPYFYCLPTGE